MDIFFLNNDTLVNFWLTQPEQLDFGLNRTHSCKPQSTISMDKYGMD